jgi:hypothetical protein
VDLLSRRGTRWTVLLVAAGVAIVVALTAGRAPDPQGQGSSGASNPQGQGASGASDPQGQGSGAGQAPHRRRGAQPRCFGAASRDPEHACNNPKLAYLVVPTPSKAQIGGPCKRIERTRESAICAFGVRSAKARATIALVGDSHAAHWRAAVDVVARAKRWRGVSFYRSQCQFTLAITRLAEPSRTRCIRWNRRVLRWFKAHPSVGTMFVSENSYAGITIPSGQDPFAAKVAGYTNAWNALPKSVKHIIVIRDPPFNAITTTACIERAMSHRQRAGLKCALPRSTALVPDPVAAAADQLRSPRVQVVDLTPFMCDSQLCYPVVGGALVHKDSGHLTRVFATTLGPFLLRDVDRLRAFWR